MTLRCSICGASLQPPQFGLTKKQDELLRAIVQYQEARGISPSFDDLRKIVGLKSKSGIHRLVNGLQERGCITFLPHMARSIVVLQKPREAA